jgi:hypothetical protein
VDPKHKRLFGLRSQENVTTLICHKKHSHNTAEGVAKCNAKYTRKRADRKLAQHGNRPPKKIRRIYWPGIPEKIGTLDVVRFSHEEIVPYPNRLQ